ncbi:MAG: tRNA (adenosine(37)-N6)-threonylcarbamoyltransferase complex dimerization subunit type 1 TsaB [Alphaproteobacteria bacterium]|nr:tRNA (adenosine(37)-N6)-threonylcarbamoyltransferase complex dimerization subunit type 1 TsaB [Alphaproteobacteria bacterium]
MKILALDSAADGCNVCLWQDGHVLSLRQEKMERGQDSRLVPLVQDVMAEADIGYDKLDRIAVTRGPGSFTGLRIGLATARGIGFAARKPVVGIDRFSIYRSLFASRQGALLVVFESRRRELYTCLFPSYGQQQTPALLTPDEIAAQTQTHHDIVVVGDAINTLQGVVDHHVFDWVTDPDVVTCAYLASQVDTKDPAYLPRPLYLRAPDVTIKGCDT